MINIKKFCVFLNFDGCAKQAFHFYEKVFQTKIKSLFRGKDSPNKEEFSPESQDAILWMEMELGGISLYGGDLQFFSKTGSMQAPSRKQYPNQFISLELSSKEEIDRVFSELSEDGIVVFPTGKIFFRIITDV